MEAVVCSLRRVSRLLLLLPLLVVAACSPTPDALSTADQEDLLRGLCEAIAAIDGVAGDAADAAIGTAEAAFFTRAHAPLHTLAGRLTDDGTVSTAAELLVAKQRVESSFDQGLPISILHDNLATLLDAADAGLEAVGLRHLDCSGSSQ
jgi:hypothetical protein